MNLRSRLIALCVLWSLSRFAVAVELLDLPKQGSEVARKVSSEQMNSWLPGLERAPPPDTPEAVNEPGKPPLQKVGTTWGDVFNPKGDAPLGAFKAYYFNTDRPRDIIAQEQVDDVSINYAWADFHGIKSEDFGAYWVGRMHFEEPQLRLIGIDQSWAKTRVIVDREIVYEGGQNALVPYRFERGDHLVEVEYLNNWHTTNVRVGFGTHVPMSNPQQVRAELERRGVSTELDGHYVGVYESKLKDQSVVLDVSGLPRDAVLILSSYSAVKWIVTPGSSRRIKAVVVASYSPGSEIVGVDEQKTAVVLYKQMLGGYALEASCHCVAGTYHCESSQTLETLRNSFDQVSGAHLQSFNVAYGGERFAVPGTALTDAALEQDRLRRESDAVKRQQCQKKADPDFEHMMEQAP